MNRVKAKKVKLEVFLVVTLIVLELELILLTQIAQLISNVQLMEHPMLIGVLQVFISTKKVKSVTGQTMPNVQFKKPKHPMNVVKCPMVCILNQVTAKVPIGA